ncbi:hypothetical protein HDU76_006650, partial [Blyttiomyces sp. JEL0837]
CREDISLRSSSHTVGRIVNTGTESYTGDFELVVAGHGTVQGGVGGRSANPGDVVDDLPVYVPSDLKS